METECVWLCHQQSTSPTTNVKGDTNDSEEDEDDSEEDEDDEDSEEDDDEDSDEEYVEHRPKKAKTVHSPPSTSPQSMEAVMDENTVPPPPTASSTADDEIRERIRCPFRGRSSTRVRARHSLGGVSSLLLLWHRVAASEPSPLTGERYIDIHNRMLQHCLLEKLSR